MCCRQCGYWMQIECLHENEWFAFRGQNHSNIDYICEDCKLDKLGETNISRKCGRVSIKKPQSNIIKV